MTAAQMAKPRPSPLGTPFLPEPLRACPHASSASAHLAGVEWLVQELKARVRERLHGVTRRHDGVGLGVDDVAKLLHQLQAMALGADKGCTRRDKGKAR